MRQLLAMTRKDFLLWTQKPGSWLVVFVVPLIFIWLIEAVFGTRGTPTVTVYAVNIDEGASGAQVMEALRNTEIMEIEVLETREEADQHVGAGDRMAAIIIPEDFSQALKTPDGARIEMIVDPARAEQANLVFGLVNSVLSPMIVDAEVNRGVESGVRDVIRILRGDITPAPQETALPQSEDPFPIFETPSNTQFDSGTPTPLGADDPFAAGFQVSATPTLTPTVDFALSPTLTIEADPFGSESSEDQSGDLGGIDETDPAIQFLTAAFKSVVSSQVEEALEDPQVQMQVEPFGGQVNDDESSLLDYLVPGYSLMFMFFLVSNLATTLVEERETGALRRLLVAPVPRSRILLGKMLPYFLIAVVQLVFILLVSRFAFGIDLSKSPMALILVIFSSALAMVSLGILIASLVRTEGQADGVAILVVLAMAVISGAMFPNIFVTGLRNLTPHYWAMKGFLNVLSLGLGVSGVLLPAGVLLSMSAVFFTIGAIRFRFE